MPKPKPSQPIPDPPLLVLAQPKRGKNPPIRWYARVSPDSYRGPRFVGINQIGWTHASDLKVVKHDRNDAEAVKIITEAKQ